MYNKKLVLSILFIEACFIGLLIFMGVNTYHTNSNLEDMKIQLDSVNAKLDSINQEVISVNNVLYD